MKKTLTTLAALAVCAGPQLFAAATSTTQAKCDTVSFSLTTYAQASVSTSKSANAGLWSQGPLYYKTAQGKIATSDILKDIAIVLHGNSGYYTSPRFTAKPAQLVLSQGELGGFFGYPYSFDGVDTTDGDNIRFAIGRNMTNNPITGALPPGHNQPWGQFFVAGYDSKGNVTNCDNVSFFFAIQVQECYDCFYLSSFISDATFTLTQQKGPPCCAGSAFTKGSGKDKYYMTLQFDNTINNPYLNPTDFISVQYTTNGGYAGSVAGSTNVIFFSTIEQYNEFYGTVGGSDGLYPGVVGLIERDNGVNPDGLTYVDSITSTVIQPVDHHPYDLFTLRFALNGIMTYNWNLQFINKGDAFVDFVGTGNFGDGAVGKVTGYGYYQKVCTLFNGTVTFSEKIMDENKCCINEDYTDNGYAPNAFYSAYWFGVGDFDRNSDLSLGNPDLIENYFDTAVAGNIDTGHLGDDVPVNTDFDLSFHVNFNYSYEPLKEWIGGEYPQPGFEGSWDDVPGGIILFDEQVPQSDPRAADGSTD